MILQLIPTIIIHTKEHFEGGAFKIILCVNNEGGNQFLNLTLLFYLFAQKSCKNCRDKFANILQCNIWSCNWFPPSSFTQRIILRVPLKYYVWKTAHLNKLQGSVPLIFLQVCQVCWYWYWCSSLRPPCVLISQRMVYNALVNSKPPKITL